MGYIYIESNQILLIIRIKIGDTALTMLTLKKCPIGDHESPLKQRATDTRTETKTKKETDTRQSSSEALPRFVLAVAVYIKLKYILCT